ncbi:hypothetical protein M441DRAFT_400002 [Trichoderma asperellum CBS 433.97]|uniref:Uncharacterized protein n=1 Tax=Trichoderma asperellum (strain ATCC 204424 / CBS 433.97 / NBRC 101777) TaxID=1042311 RepID=A0A2T3Z9Q7_TRIA4|nr:hypothetical protein M441DRAFT_400002 [Trichoderma asperellum CBS 433.97]PTB41512.1 hypothetical protein M441DRAFT_400002 [Trichoderma asperellum CBS 433.97]
MLPMVMPALHTCLAKSGKARQGIPRWPGQPFAYGAIARSLVAARYGMLEQHRRA